ncbi:transglycosylase SLT domain-containing protein [Candidatus Synechococcus calcipolaris G9]|uniref:Transglycosylase SLT domain-containing protein n=1 Tax=Candidatus Synechococcus calcipolaris G9 TaxID=1497997 RepID=A0ABT6EYU7_9SYNE|nr:transglycosylase SLT domain-containing protein [Candidatus Synechococcus calcipolaris]MDG2990667.1 transglycosylase SLT domain-containing protein [Candidatus Synechococcus calcipolaris G9]
MKKPTTPLKSRLESLVAQNSPFAHLRRWSVGVGIVLVAIAGGGAWYLWQQSPMSAPSSFYHLAIQSPEQRQDQLLQIAQGEPGRERDRAHYLLAVDALDKDQPEDAIRWLKALEMSYPPMTAPILVLRAEAYRRLDDFNQARSIWEDLLRRYPDQPEAAVALLALNNPDAAIARFPQHPLVVEFARQQLAENSDQLPLLVLIARHGLHLPDYGNYLELLTKSYADELTPEDWEAIAFGYWEKLNYKSAGQAYSQAPPSPLNLYRAGRGLQLGQEKEAAISAYQKLITAHPQSSESALAWLRLAQINENPQEKLQLLDRAIATADTANRPDLTGDALKERFLVYESLKATAEATQTQKQLLDRFGQTPGAAELRWMLADRYGKQANWDQARHWAKELVKHNPTSDLAPRAAFWDGLWAQAAGKGSEIKPAWNHLRQAYPHSYYAWRAAGLSQEPVGQFSTISQLQPRVDPQRFERLPLMAGSETLQELYLLGQSQPAWERWQWEFRNRVEPSGPEQLSDGLIRMGVGEYLDGIFMLENLGQRSQREPDIAQFFDSIRTDPRYWYALYPLPYWDTVEKWATSRNLNPLLVMGLIRQESRFQKDIQSIAGAAGLMQVMPETAEWIADRAQIESYDLNDPEDSIRLGTWYLDHTLKLYDQDALLALAGYNAGPGHVDDWLKRFGYTSADRFVESIPFPETYGYVKSVLENYWNYLRLYNNG